ncbi:MAG: hypothetical protein QXW80_01450 [Candidatus Micrarchaeia archaeon]
MYSKYLGKQNSNEHFLNTLIVSALVNAQKEPDSEYYVSKIQLSKGAEELFKKLALNYSSDLRTFFEKQNKTVFFLFQKKVLDNIRILKEEDKTYLQFNFNPLINFFKLTPDGEKVIAIVSRLEKTKRKNYKYNFLVTTTNINKLVDEIKKYTKDEIEYNQIDKDKFNITIKRGDPKVKEISENAKFDAFLCLTNIYLSKNKRNEFVKFLVDLWNAPYNDFENRKAIEEVFSKAKWEVWNEVKNYLPTTIRNQIAKKREEALPKERLEQIKKETIFQRKYKPLDKIIALMEDEESKNKVIKSDLKTLRKEINKVLKVMKKAGKEEQAKKEIEDFVARNLEENWYSKFDEIMKFRAFLRKKYEDAFK